MTIQEQQLAERQAIVNFMGTIFGEARRIDKDMIQQSSTLQPTSHRAEQALRSYLQTQAPTVIPPAPVELASAGAGVNDHPVHQIYTDTPPEGLIPTTTIPRPQTLYTDKEVNQVDVLQKLDKIIELLKQIVLGQHNNNLPDIPHEDTNQQRSVPEFFGSGSED